MNFCHRPDPRSLFQQGWPLTSLSFIKTSPKPSISLWIQTWPLSTATIPHFPAADQHFLLQLHSSFQGTLLARNSSPGIPSLLPSAVLGEVGRFLHTESHTTLRKDKILKLFLLWSLENKNDVSYLRTVLCLIWDFFFFLFKMRFVNGTGDLLCWMCLHLLIFSSYTRNFAKCSFFPSPSLPNPPSQINWQPFMSILWQFLLHSRREECTGQIVQHSFAKTLSCFSSCQTSLK